MLLNLMFSIFLTIPIQNDTMQLPVPRGKVYDPDSAKFKMEQPNGIYISILKTSYIRSCSDGSVGIAKNMKNIYGFAVSVNSKKETFAYTMLDSIFVKPKQVIHKGDILGIKYKSSEVLTYIGFSVMNQNKVFDAKKYLIYNQ